MEYVRFVFQMKKDMVVDFMVNKNDNVIKTDLKALKLPTDFQIERFYTLNYLISNLI